MRHVHTCKSPFAAHTAVNSGIFKCTLVTALLCPPPILRALPHLEIHLLAPKGEVSLEFYIKWGVHLLLEPKTMLNIHSVLKTFHIMHPKEGSQGRDICPSQHHNSNSRAVRCTCPSLGGKTTVPPLTHALGPKATQKSWPVRSSVLKQEWLPLEVHPPVTKDTKFTLDKHHRTHRAQLVDLATL